MLQPYHKVRVKHSWFRPEMPSRRSNRFIVFRSRESATRQRDSVPFKIPPNFQELISSSIRFTMRNIPGETHGCTALSRAPLSCLPPCTPKGTERGRHQKKHTPGPPQNQPRQRTTCLLPVLRVFPPTTTTRQHAVDGSCRSRCGTV